MTQASMKIKLPKKLVKVLGLKLGDRLELVVDEEGNRVVTGNAEAPLMRHLVSGQTWKRMVLSMCVSFAKGGNCLPTGEIERTVDTDIIVDMLCGVRASRDYMHRFECGELKGSISVTVVAEPFSGRHARDLSVVQRINAVIALFTIMPVTLDIARRAGELARDYGLSLPDALIAATALARNAVLVTRNVEDFQSIPHLRLEVPY